MRKSLAVFLASLVIAFSIFPIMFLAYEKNYVEVCLKAWPPALRPYIDYLPFFSTWYGDFTKAVWIAMIAVIIVDFLWMRKLKISMSKQIFMVLTILTMVCGITFHFIWDWSYKIYAFVAGMFLFAVWAIFLLKLFLEKVCPHIRRSFKKKPMVNTLEACPRLAPIEGQGEGET